MKKTRLTALLCGVLCVSALIFAAASVTASTDTDPLITLSYLEKVAFPKFKDDVLASVPKPEPAQPTATQNVSASYSVIEVLKDQTVLAGSVCEIIVRPGSSAVCVSPFEDQGIADITLGSEILNGTEIPINSYCIIPRGNDGRGIKILSEKAYIMIRGDYTIG